MMVKYREQPQDMIYALDIGTRSIVGVAGKQSGERFEVLAIESAEHGRRTMMDGQIDDIQGVARLVEEVTQRLERRLEVSLSRVCIAAAGRSLQMQKGSFAMELPPEKAIDETDISRLEAGALSAAEEALQQEEDGRQHQQFYMVGYTASQYRLDNYPLQLLSGHSGKVAEADVVATFLPGEVVESLYAAMRMARLQVANMTLEPIAAMNAAIPAEIRLLNLALVDIGAGTSDIALCRDGSVVGYTMVVQAGDEISEAIMRTYLVDFQTAEMMKRALAQEEPIRYVNILGLEEETSVEQVSEAIQDAVDHLAKSIGQQILAINSGSPSALFMAGGGSRLQGLAPRIAYYLGMDEKRVAMAGSNFKKSAFSEVIDINNPEYTTPLGIAISASMGLLNDSYVVNLNGSPAKLFRNGTLPLRDILLMNGFGYGDFVGRTGKNLTITVDGRRMLFRGEPGAPAVLRVNDEDATITTLIHAGDRIEFIPARSGLSPKKTVADVVGFDFSGRVMVNNREATLQMELNSGDVILTMPSTSGAAVQPEPLAASSVKTDEKMKQPVAAPAPQVEAASSRRAAPAVEKVVPMPTGISRGVPAEEPPAPSYRRSRSQLRIILNDAPLLLDQKPNGEPYYLMDVLQYADIDFQNTKQPVYLEINGRTCSFRDILQEQDVVTVRLG